MLTSFEQLEKEIDKFHETVAASNELVRLMKSIADAVTNQTNTFNKQADSLEKVISRVPDEIKSDYDELLKRFSNEKKSYVEALGSSNSELLDRALTQIREAQDSHNVVLKKLNADFAGIIDAYLSEVSKLQDSQNDVFVKHKADLIEKIAAYLIEVSSLQKEIEVSEENINEKYKAFLSDLENLNIQHLYEISQEILAKQERIIENNNEKQKSLMTSITNHVGKRFIFLYCGMGLIVLLVILSFFIK